MNRILIIGCGGAGKSTLAIQLAERLGLELIHLDYYFWRPGWQSSAPEEWNAKVRELIAGDCWVMDGNYGGTLDMRARAADTIIFLDLSRWICLRGLLSRWLAYRGETRPSLPDNCPERIDSEFFWYVWNYRKSRRPGILEKLQQYRQQGKNILIFKNRKAISIWLGDLG